MKIINRKVSIYGMSIPNSLSPILPNCPSPPFTVNDSFILNPDDSYVLPLLYLNNTYVFDLNQLTSN